MWWFSLESPVAELKYVFLHLKAEKDLFLSFIRLVPLFQRDFMASATAGFEA